MFRRKPRVVQEPYQPIHEYNVEIQDDHGWGAQKAVTLIISRKDGEWDKLLNRPKRIYWNVFVGRDAFQQAEWAVLPFIERHEKEGFTKDFRRESFVVKATHVCEVEEEC
jgi:hypothetical protein